MLWRVRGRLVSWSNNFVDILFYPFPFRHPTVRSESSRPWYVRVYESTLEKIFQYLCDLDVNVQTKIIAVAFFFFV